MQKSWVKKGLICGIILLFVGSGLVSGINNIKIISNKGGRGNTLYVGGSGPGNYTHIQDAIDNAGDGDTVFVYTGTYHESLIIEKSLNLVGENRTKTIVDSGHSTYVIDIFVCTAVSVRRFTIQNSSKNGINSEAVEIELIDNIVKNHGYVGICLKNSSKTIVTNNIISQNERGLCLCWGCCNSTVSFNIIEENNYCAIYLYNSSNNRVVENLFTNNEYGVVISRSDHNNITKNIFKYCNLCNIYLYHANDNRIMKNNFIDYRICALFSCCSNSWDANYWNGPRFLPKPIFGRIGQHGLIPWVNFDWHPVQEPYDIPRIAI